MRTVLVCVRTPIAARNVASAAARLGMSAAVRTAVSEPEVLLRLAEGPAEVVLADTALTRPDSAGFTRRVLARAPGAVLVLFGPEDPRVAAAAIAAGARGLIQGGDHDLVSVVAKALLLLCVPGRAGVGLGAGRGTAGSGVSGTGGSARLADRSGVPPLPGQPTMVPAQRGDEGHDGFYPPQADPRAGNSPDGRYAGPPTRRDTGPPAMAAPAGPPGRRITLTERELQVLRGMSDGKSNAEIGRELFVSEDTVKTHARRLFRKLGARDRAHAVAAGFRAGLVA
ncbi:response regulator transcription factor [Polymorphospora lycopeni]|uniref:Helix-turn-helix transcriptional regulator n=1 Tax=Polymorphospora lycopeni TaxID=3140240 RepID=A0ABV5CYU2_9ACTN